MSLFSKIDEPLKFRRTLLSTAKNTVIIQKKQLTLNEFKEQKKVLINKLHDDMSFLNERVSFLESLLVTEDIKEQLKSTPVKEKTPEPVKEAPKEEFIPIEEKTPVKEAKKEVESPVSDLDRLEYTLNKIEERLKKL